MFRRVVLVAVALAVAAIAACRTATIDVTLPPEGDDDDDAATPYFGSASDGDVVVTVPVNVNPCRAITSTSGAHLQLGGNVAPFSDGDLLFLWQVQAPTVLAFGDTNAAIVVTTAGAWELARALLVEPATTSVNLAQPASFAYRSDADFRAQVCRVPEFHDLTVPTLGELDAAPWDGATGGFAGWAVDGTFTLDGSVDAGAAGFRGGPHILGASIGLVVTEETSATDGGAKGEGIDRRALVAYGRGQLANAAGGGNGQNAGGGGGGNAGRGGYGGRQNDLAGGVEPETKGRPGGGLPPDLSRLFAGGGGGEGHDNEGAGQAGGNGGGVVLIIARQMQGGGTIASNGETALDSTNDGGSGGGAGGTIVVRTAGAFAGKISVRGGFGGNSIFPTDNRGPGGGGGGGFVALDGDFTEAIVDTSGGINGTSGPEVPGDPYASTPGSGGARVAAPPIAIPTPP